MIEEEITRVGYHTELTTAVIENLYEAIDIGLNDLDAAESAGITIDQFCEWQEAGNEELSKLARDSTFQTGIHGLLAKSVIRARLTFKMRNLQILRTCTEAGSVEGRLARVTAAAWLLEHYGRA